MAERTYGEIPGVPSGTWFINRAALTASKIHRPNQAGICGGVDGAESIVVSGGYVDDEDYGDEIIYTGQGGNDPNTKRQVADQGLTRGNAGLARSQADGHPVRVVRGAGGDPEHSPASGYRYDGLFRVVDHWHEIGKDGFRIWRFRLVTLENPDVPITPPRPLTAGKSADRALTTIQRIVRSTQIAAEAKRLHDYTCQICGIRLSTPVGAYAEAAHIRGLGKPHDGPDELGNVLCLCPNDHILFDTGAIYIDSFGLVRETSTNTAISKLREAPGHIVDQNHLAYHRSHQVP